MTWSVGLAIVPAGPLVGAAIGFGSAPGGPVRIAMDDTQVSLTGSTPRSGSC